MVDSSQSEPHETLVTTRHDETFGFDWELYLRRVEDFGTPMDVPVVRVPGRGGVGHGVFDLDEPVDADLPGSGIGEISPGLLAASYVMPKGVQSRAEIVCIDGSVVPGHVVGLQGRAVDIYVCFVDRQAARLRLHVDGRVIERPISTANFEI